MPNTELIEQPNVPSWTELTNDQQTAVISLALSGGRVNKASALFKKSTGKSRSTFYERVYPEIKLYWKNLAPKVPETALLILQGGSVNAAYELVSEIDHKDVKIRNKASNDVLDKALQRNNETSVQVNIANIIQRQRGDYNLDE